MQREWMTAMQRDGEGENVGLEDGGTRHAPSGQR